METKFIYGVNPELIVLVKYIKQLKTISQLLQQIKPVKI